MDTTFLRGQKRLLEAARKEDGRKGGSFTRKRFAEDFARDIADVPEKSTLQLRELWEHVIPDGREFIEDYRSNGNITLLEAGGAADSVAFTDFSNITNQWLFSMVKEQLARQMFLHKNMGIPSKFTPWQNGERVPGVGPLGDDSEVIPEGEEYPTAKLTEEYIELPNTSKRGFKVNVTKEAAFGDQTGRVTAEASSLTEAMGYEEEKRYLDLITGQTNSYKYNGNSINTYGDNSGTHNWDNLLATNGLVDYTDIQNALLAWDDMTHPTNGEPIMPAGYTMVLPTDLVMKARTIINATELQTVDNQATTPTLRYTSPNPLAGLNLGIASNAYVSARTSSASTWYIGDFTKAFCKIYNWLLTTDQAPMNSHLMYDRDIVMSFKVSEKSEYGVIEPRYVIKCTA
ncbi:MAG TPA: hypothetical protein VLA12_00745 [Planctomycetaceae bacterium]|nr:hypothetical protein [Planctomycetaceae bacterium]